MEVIAAVKEELSEGRALDQLFEKGDPKLFERMIEFSADGFKKLLPVAMSKWASIDLPAYQKHFAAVIDGELAGMNIEGRLGFIDRLLAKNDVEGVKAELASIKADLGQYKGIAAKKIETPAADPNAANERAQLDAREHQIWVQENSGPINREKTALIKSAVTQYLPKGEILTDETLEAIELHVNRFLDPLLQADPNFAATFKAFEQNRDAAGMKKFILSKVKELLPSKTSGGQTVMGPAEKATKLFFRGAPKSAPRAAAGRPGAGTPPPPAPKGWERISPDKAPSPFDIDKAKTPFEMSMAKAAVLKNGKKVFWGDKAPATA